MNFKQKSVIFLATGCYSGKIPFAPGAFGSMAGLPVCYLLSGLDMLPAILFTLCFIGIAVWISQKAEKLVNAKDPGCIVIDEIAGMMVALFGLPFTPVSASAGFFIFRAFDIVKPFPVRFLEKKLPGGAGVVFDDIAAGIYSNLALRALFFLAGPG